MKSLNEILEHLEHVKNEQRPTDCHKKIIEMNEAAYRRGYVQGYFTATEDSQDGYSFEQMKKFLSKNLMNWRYRKTLKKVIFAPELPWKGDRNEF